MRFFFKVRDHEFVIDDTEGFEFPDLKAAHAEAKIAVREMVATMVFQGDPIDGEVLEVCGADGTVLLVIPFKTAVRFSPCRRD